jgi:hypothetical protein
MVNELTKGLSEGKQIDVILLDFSKAFDKVPHVYKTVFCEDSNWGTDNFREVVDKGQEQKWAQDCPEALLNQRLLQLIFRQMMFHPEKCTTIHISKKRNPIHMVIHLSVPGSKYLGVRVNKDLSWNDHYFWLYVLLVCPIVVVAAFW